MLAKNKLCIRGQGSIITCRMQALRSTSQWEVHRCGVRCQPKRRLQRTRRCLEFHFPLVERDLLPRKVFQASEIQSRPGNTRQVRPCLLLLAARALYQMSVAQAEVQSLLADTSRP